MAISKFYLKRDATTLSGTLVGDTATVSASTPTYIGAAGNLSETMTSVISTANHTSLTLSVPGNLTVARSGLIARWYSEPVAAQTFNSQTITVSIAVQENNLDSNYQFTWVLAVWRPSTGALVGRIWDQVSAAAEPATTGVTAVTLGTGGSSSSVTAQSGDVLVFEAWRASSVTAATNTRNNLVYFDGTTEGSASNNAAYVQFTNAVLMAFERPVSDSITASDTVTFSTSGNVGTKKFYLHAADHTVPGTFPNTSTSVSGTAPTKITTTNLAESMDQTIGTSQTSVTHVTNAVSTAQSGLIARFVSRPLAAQTFTSQALDLSVAVSQSNNDSNFFPTFVLAVWRPSTGAVVGRLFDAAANAATEATTSQAVRTVSSGGTSTQVTAVDGDVLILEVWRSSQAQGSTNARNNVVFFDGTTDDSATSTAAYLTFANTVLFKKQDASRPVADTLTSSDTSTATSSRSRSIADTLTSADTAACGVGTARAAADAATLADAAVAGSTASRSVTDTVTLVEDIDAVGPGGNVSHEANLDDSITAADTVARALTVSAAASDTVMAVGQAARSVAAARAVADSVAVTDALTGPGSLARSVSDSVTFSDTVAGDGPVNLSEGVADSITASDVSAGQVAASRSAGDAVVFSDVVSPAVTVSAGAPDSVSVVDVVARQVAAAATLSDLVTLSDDLARAVTLVAAAADTLILGGTITTQIGFSAAAADVVTVVDQVDWSAPTTPGVIVPAVPAGALMQATTAAAATVSGSTQADGSQSAGSDTTSSITPAQGAAATMTGA